MGCCVPESILGEDGRLTRMHPSLESLSLVTDATCDSFDEQDRDASHTKMDLSPFRKLKSICWKGPLDSNQHVLSTAIKNNAHHLDSLELGLFHWLHKEPDRDIYDRSHEGHDDNPGYFGNTLKLHQHAPQPMFQQLTSLVLAGAPLGPAMVEMINFDVLRSLTLRSCPGWETFTQRIVKMGLPVKLKTFELHYALKDAAQRGHAELDLYYGCPNRLSEVEEFIHVCEGLEELFLNLPKPRHAWSLWKHISHREASLKRFVLHHRTPYYNCTHLEGDDVDLPNLGLTEREDRLYHPPLLNPLRELKLECISLLPFLKLIHIRQTGRDRQVFGNIAIDRGSSSLNRAIDGGYGPFDSPDGPPLLQAVAYGDFAHEGRANTENFILCRRPNGFRQVPKSSYEWEGIVEKFRNVLEACPTKPLLMWPSTDTDDVDDW
ncbi:hypothetical protein N0V84_010405 [Fusarium piperis]|uniref:Uncharacterized protein n=1 Tax=Fusarium piperis TaxID=1435070 RepID=A0A9W8TFR0_9HYPO|nr:hypothetical protein N0V84_010405 [Fusarium piperis]